MTNPPDLVETLPACLNRMNQPKGPAMTTPEPTAGRKPRKAKVIISTITLHAAGNPDDDDYVDKVLEMRQRVTAALHAINSDAPDWLIVSALQPKQGRVPE